MSTIQTIANDLVQRCQRGDFAGAIHAHYSPNIVSQEAMEGEMSEIQGLDAVLAKTDWWNQTFEVLESNVTGPWINRDQFAVGFKLTVRERASGKETTLEEVAVYTVADGKIVHERFFG